MSTPSRKDVDLCIEQLGIEEEREREALRKFWARERVQDRAANKRLAWALCKFFFKVALVAAVVGLILVLS